MEKTLKLSAILIANQLDIKSIKAHLEVKPHADSSTELFFNDLRSTKNCSITSLIEAETIIRVAVFLVSKASGLIGART